MAFPYKQTFKQSIQDIKDEGRYRKFTTIERINNQFPKAYFYDDQNQKKEVTVWCSNDYLGMGQHPKITRAAQQAIEKSGVGAGGTRNISGTTKYHKDLEESVADLHQKQRGLIFSSGYTANEGTLMTLGRLLPDAVFLSDQLNHASMIHGMKDSKCQIKIFRHNDIEHLESLLKSLPADIPKIIAFESIYSMEGDVAPINEICDLADQYNALTYLDEVHAVGLYGPRGGGMAEQLGIMERIDIIEGTFGKGYGSMGGFITGDADLIDAIRSFSSSFIFTTSLPPATLAASLAAVEHLKTSQDERVILQENTKLLKGVLTQGGLNFYDGGTHIIPLILGSDRCCKELASILLDVYNIYVQPINYPTVPKGTERLRLTASAVHSRQDIMALGNILSGLWQMNHNQDCGHLSCISAI